LAVVESRREGVRSVRSVDMSSAGGGDDEARRSEVCEER